VSSQDVHRSVAVPEQNEPWFRKALAYAGPGALVAVGYMDPGNWATDIAGGSAYNYDLMFVVLWSSLLGLFYQVSQVGVLVTLFNTTIYHTLYIIHYTYTIYHTLYIIHYISYTIHTLYIIHYISYITLSTVLPAVSSTSCSLSS
jgi:hypothetical protein